MPSLAVSLDHVAAAGFAFDAGDRIVSWNPAAADLYGLSPAEAVGQSVLLLIPHEATADFQRAVEVVHQQGRWHGELRTEAVDHTPRVVEAAWSSLGGRVVVALHTDVTDRQRRQRDERRTAALRGIRSVAREVVAPALATHLRLVTEWDDLSLLHGNGRGVLILSPSRLTRELVRQLLVGHDYVAFTADTVFEAAELLRRFRDGIQAVVLDFPDAAEELCRVRPQLPTVPLKPGTAGRELLEAVALAIAEEELNPV